MSSLSDLVREAMSRVRPGRGIASLEAQEREAVISALTSDASIEPPTAATDRGRQALLSQLHEVPIGGTGKMFSQFLMSPIVAAAAATVLLVSGMAGVSAATGGPDVTEPVRDAVGVNDGDDGAASTFTPAPTPEASPDNDRDDDNNGPGGGDDGDDNSGPGGGGDDDNSGPGGGSDDHGNSGPGGGGDEDSPPSPGATPDDDDDPQETAEPSPTDDADGGDDDDDNGGHGGDDSGGNDSDDKSGPGS